MKNSRNPLYWENKKLESDYIDNQENLREEKYEKDKLRFSKLEKPDPNKFAPGEVIKFEGKFYKRDNREVGCDENSRIYEAYTRDPKDWDYHWKECFYIEKLNFSVTYKLIVELSVLFGFIITLPISLPILLIQGEWKKDPTLGCISAAFLAGGVFLILFTLGASHCISEGKGSCYNILDNYIDSQDEYRYNEVRRHKAPQWENIGFNDSGR